MFPSFTKNKQSLCYSAWGAWMTRAGCRHDVWDHVLQCQLLHIVNHMFYYGTLHSWLYSFLGTFFKGRCHYAAYFSNLMHTFCYTHLLSFDNKEDNALLITTTCKRALFFRLLKSRRGWLMKKKQKKKKKSSFRVKEKYWGSVSLLVVMPWPLLSIV